MLGSWSPRILPCKIRPDAVAAHLPPYTRLSKEIAGVLAQLPRRSAVLTAKPMGGTLSAAREILAVCRERELVIVNRGSSSRS